MKGHTVKFSFLVSTIFLSFYVSGQGVQSILGTPGNERTHDIIQTSDGNSLSVGYVSNGMSGSNDALLIKMNNVGDTIWTKIIGDAGSDIGHSVVELSTGGFLIAGSDDSKGLGITTDFDGNVLWTKYYGGSANEIFYSADEASDGNLYFGGRTQYGPGAYDAYVVKTNSAGSVIWTKVFGAGGHDFSFDITATDDNGIVSVGQGWGTSYSMGVGNGLIVKLNSVGAVSWETAVGSSSDDQLLGVIETSDNSILACGYYGAGGRQALITKLSSSGSVLWSKTYGGSSSDSFSDISETSDGGFIAAGTSTSFSGGMTDIYLVRVDSNGDTLWTKGYGGVSNDGGTSGLSDLYVGVTQLSDGGFRISTYTESFGSGAQDILIITTDSLGNTSNCIQFETTTTVASISISTGSGASFSSGGSGTTVAFSQSSSDLIYDQITPIIDLFSDSLSCFDSNDGSASAIATGGDPTYSYLWNDPLSQTNDTATGLTPGIYTVSVTDAAGCIISDSIEIFAPEELIANISTSTDVTCFEDCDGIAESTVTGGSAPYNYLWDDPLGQTTALADDLCAGSYEVLVTDNNGCEETVSIIINEPEMLDTSVTKSGFTLSSAPSGLTYQWLDCKDMSIIAGATSQNYTSVYNGDFAVIVSDGVCTDTSGCWNIDSITSQSIDENDIGLELFPNPTSGLIQVITDGVIIKKITINSSLGQIILEENPNSNMVNLDLSSYASGVYIIKVETESGYSAGRIILE